MIIVSNILIITIFVKIVKLTNIGSNEQEIVFPAPSEMTFAQNGRAFLALIVGAAVLAAALRRLLCRAGDAGRSVAATAASASNNDRTATLAPTGS
jgi:hypothetical protein